MRKIWVLSVVAILVVLCAATPYLFSAYPFKRIVERTFEKKVGGTAKIDRVQFTWLGPQRLEGVHVTTAQINGVIKEMSSTVPFWSIGSYATAIEYINGSGTTNIDGQKGQFSVQATKVAPNEISVQFSANNMPTAATLQLLKMDDVFLALIGPSFNANGSASLRDNEGDLTVQLASARTNGSIKGTFSPNALTLQEPLTFACYLTPEFTQKVTNGAVAIQSKTPTRVRIESEGFSCPRPFSLAKLRISTANVDFGQIILQHANLTPLATLLRADSLTASQISMWLTDVDWSLENGRLEVGRIDGLLADSIHLCAWGKANLVQDQLDMIFGIPGDTITKSLRIKNISSSYVLQVPVTGSLRNPKIDANAASSKIAFLLAGSQVQKQGGIIGGVATVIGKVAEEKSPPPKRPFPWE